MLARLRKECLFTILLFCLSIGLSLLLAETVLQLYLPSSYYIWPPNLVKVFKPHQEVMPGVAGEARFEINSLGVRGDELDSSHTYRILAIGGSTTECMFLDQSETWPHLLQKTLNENVSPYKVWVGNAGMSGRTTRHHLMAMHHLPLRKMKIDAIIFLVGINDFSKRLSRDTLYDPNILTRDEARNELMKETFIGTSPTYFNEPSLKKTAVWQTFRKTKALVLQNNILGNRPDKPDHKVNNKNAKKTLQDEVGKVYITWRKHRQQAAEIRTTLPDLSSALEEYARNINQIIDVAQENSIRVIFMTQPTMWRSGLPEELDSLLWFGGIGEFQKESGKPYYSVEALENGMRQYNEVLLHICQERGVECIDLSYLEKDTTVFYDDVHFNESGAWKVSRVLANHLINQETFTRARVASVFPHF